MDAYTEKLFDSGVALLARRDERRAVAILERAVARFPDDPQLLLRVAHAYERHGALGAAISAYRRLAEHYDGREHVEKADELRERARHIEQTLAVAAVEIDERPRARQRGRGRAREPSQPTPGLLAFCLGVLVVIYPFSATEVPELLERAERDVPARYALDGRTALARALALDEEMGELARLEVTSESGRRAASRRAW